MRKKKKPAAPIKDKNQIELIKLYLKDKNLRDYVVFNLGIATGYRAGDLLKLRVIDVKNALEHGYFVILEGKKANSKNIKEENIKPREVKIQVALSKLLKEYIKGKRDYEVMFASNKGKNTPIQVARISRILASAGAEFGIKGISAHSMRKTYAWWIYTNSGYNLTLVKEMLGHSSETETRAYLGLDKETYDQYADSLNDFIG